jgi:hypothetical protein
MPAEKINEEKEETKISRRKQLTKGLCIHKIVCYLRRRMRGGEPSDGIEKLKVRRIRY